MTSKLTFKCKNFQYKNMKEHYALRKFFSWNPFLFYHICSKYETAVYVGGGTQKHKNWLKNIPYYFFLNAFLWGLFAIFRINIEKIKMINILK
jgi:hypothetical protein